MICLCVLKFPETQHNCWKLMKLVKMQDIKLTYRNHLHFYTLKMKHLKKKKELKKIPFTIASKKIKHLRQFSQESERVIQQKL